MTVSTQYQPFTFKPGAAMTAEAIPWQFLAGEQIVVTHIAAVTAAETVLVLGDDYSISGSGPDGTGSVTALAAWPVNDDFRVERATSLEQEYELPPFEAIRSSGLERENDRQLMALQEQVSTLTRAVLAPVGQDAPKLDIAGLFEGDILEYRGGKIRRFLREAFAGKFFAGDASGRPVPASGFGADAALRTDIAAPGGSALVNFMQAGTGAVARTVESKGRDVVSVFDFMTAAQIADAQTYTYTLDLKAAVQAAFNSGAKKVVFPKGGYRIDSGLTVPNWLHIAGEGYQPTIGVGAGAVVLRFTQTSGIAMSLGFNPLFEKLVIWNSGGAYNDTTKTLSGTTAVAMDLAADNVTLDKVAFHLWHTCIRFGPNSFYVNTNLVEFNRCTNGYLTNGAAPYNVCINSPISRDTTNFFAGQAAFPARNVKTFGGSIEGYQSVASGFLDFSSFGTYYETIPQRAGAYGFDPGVNGASVALFGNTVYMDHTSRFVNMSGLTNCALTGSGNQFDGLGGSGAICYYLPATGNVSLGGDLFGQGHNNNTLYVDSATSLLKFNGIVMPLLPSGNTLADYSEMQIVGPRGIIASALSAEPSAKTTGMTVQVNGSSWDPLARSAGRPYWVIWQGDRWRSLDGGV